MKNDRPKYMPDVAKVLRENEPAAFAERERNALAKLREEGIIERFTPAPAAQVSAPSPWAKDGADGAGAAIDKAELPSAMAPAVEERPVTKLASPELEKAPKSSWKLIAGLAAFVATVALVSGLVLVGQMRDAARKAAASVTVTAPSATATEAAVSSMTAAVPAMPSATAVPTLSATVMPSARVAPSTHPKTVAPAKQHDKTNDPSAEAPDAGAPSVEAAPRPSPTVFVNGAKPEF